MSKAEKCVWCGEEVAYPRVFGKRGIYHLDCFKKSGELVGSAYAAPPSFPPSAVAELMQEENNKAPVRRSTRAPRKRKK